jgi:hypothetical protein
MRFEPRPDQEDVLAWADNRRRFAIWAATGVGKTPMSLRLMHNGTYDWCDVPRWIVVAPPMVAADGWPDALRKWDEGRDFTWRVLTFEDVDLVAPTRMRNLRTGVEVEKPWPRLPEVGPQLYAIERDPLQFRDKRATKKRLQSYTEQVHICRWDVLPWVLQAYGANCPYRGAVLDEARFVKDRSTERSRAARWLATKCNIKSIIELTATPAANGVEDAWHQVFLLDGGERMGRTLTEFHETWCMPDKKNWDTGQVYSWKVRPELVDRLDALLAEVAISVPSNLGVPMIESDVIVQLPPDARRVYEELELQFVSVLQAGALIDTPNEAALRGKLKQVCQGAVYDGAKVAQHLHDAKLDRLEELLEEIGERVLLVYTFQHDKARLQSRFGARIGALTRKADRAAWEAGKKQVLSLHPASGGHGVDGLQHFARHVVWFGITEDLEAYIQTNGRLFRTGQKDTVFVHRLLADDTVDTMIARDVLPGKDSLQSATLARARARR